MSELKPCPCGSIALYETKLCDARKTYKLGNDSTCQHVICETCGFNAPADAWSTRHIPEGYALVPAFPTSEMIEVGTEAYENAFNEVVSDIYVAMITAAIEEAE